MKAVVDTDILSELYRKKNALVLERARLYEDAHGAIALSAITVFEVLQGWHQANRPEQAEAFLGWLEGSEVLVFDAECARLAGEIGAFSRERASRSVSGTWPSRRRACGTSGR